MQPATRPYLSGLALAAVLLASACTDTINHSVEDAAVGARDSSSAETSIDGSWIEDGVSADVDPEQEPTISIFIKGDTTPKTIEDGNSGQTPKEYVISLGRFDVLRSATDPDPVIVFDHGADPMEVDLLSTTLGGTARVADVQPGTYTHGRCLLTKAVVTVEATVHAGLSLPGDLEVVTALSDTLIEGEPWTQGQASFTFKAGAISHTVPAVLPMMPSTGGGNVVQEGNRTWLVFAFPEPITISHQAKTDHGATIIYQVYESFRWQEEEKPGYQAQVFDLDAVAMSWEPVMNFGATEYAVELN